MGNFNFGGLKTTQAESTSRFLRAWNIYNNVKFGGISDKITGNKQDGGTWEAYDFTFECPDGIYRERIFAPTETCEVRNKWTNAKGHEVELPSAMDTLQTFIAQVVHTFNPKGFEKLQEIAGKLNSFDELITVVKKLLANTTVTTNLKLVGRNDSGTIYATLPRFVAVNQTTHEAYTSDNFLGEKVAFTAWEKSQKETFDNAAPTPVSSDGEEETSSSSIDFDSLDI